MMEASVGFVFDLNMTRVVLIRKNRPQWQAGLLNGIGGKKEGSETPVETMCREFREEAGVVTEETDWLPLAVLQGEHFLIHAFYLVSREVYSNAVAQTDEWLEHWDVSELSESCVPSVPWLIWLAKDSNMMRGQMSVKANYVGLLDGD